MARSYHARAAADAARVAALVWCVLAAHLLYFGGIVA